MEVYIPAGQMILSSVWLPTIQEKVQKYTKARRPVELVYFEEFETKEQAMKREYAIKQMARKDKLELVRRKEKADDRSE